MTVCEAFIICGWSRTGFGLKERRYQVNKGTRRVSRDTRWRQRGGWWARLRDSERDANSSGEHLQPPASSLVQGAASQGAAKDHQTGSMEVRRDVGEAGQSSKPTLSAPPQSLGKDAVSGSAVPEDVDDGLVRPADPSFMRTELERRRNQPVRTIAERRRLLREMRRRQVAAQEQRTLRETLETERSLPPDIDVEQLESVPLVRESLSGRERGEDYWLDLNELARRPGQIRKHERPRLSLLSKFLSGGLKIRAPDRKTNDQMTALEEEIEWRRLLQELKRSDRVSMQFQELTEEVPMLPGESVEEALGRSRLGSDQAVVRSPPASNDADDIDPAMLFQLKELEPAFSRLETSVQRRDNGSVLVIRRYVPRISARILELRDRRLRRKLRQERGQLSSKMRDQVRAELVLPYSQNWIALMVGAIGALVLLTWLFGQSGPIIELPDL